MEKKGASAILIAVVVIGLVLLIGGYFLFSGGDSDIIDSDEKDGVIQKVVGEDFKGACFKYAKYRENELEGCTENYGYKISQCSVDDDIYRLEWITEKCPTENVIGVCKYWAKNNQKIKILMFSYSGEESDIKPWCDNFLDMNKESYDGEFISGDEL